MSVEKIIQLHAGKLKDKGTYLSCDECFDLISDAVEESLVEFRYNSECKCKASFVEEEIQGNKCYDCKKILYVNNKQCE